MSREIDINLLDDFVRAKSLLKNPFLLKVDHRDGVITIPIIIIDASLLEHLLSFIEEGIN